MSTFGWLTTILFTLSWCPQLYKTAVTGSIKDFHPWALVLPLLGSFTGMVYTSQIHNSILFTGYFFNAICVGILLFFYRFSDEY